MTKDCMGARKGACARQDDRKIFVACAAASPAFGVCLRPLVLRASSRKKPEISGAAHAENFLCLSAQAPFLVPSQPFVSHPL